MTSSCHRPLKTRNGREGFSLVELSLALFAVSLALLGVFGLFPSGMKAARHAQEDTICALFATEIFDSIRAEAADASDVEWAAFNNQAFSLAVAKYSNASDIPTITANAGSFETITFELSLSSPSGGIVVEDHTVRCKLDIADGAFPYSKKCILEVYPFAVKGYKKTFYTEVVRWRM
jgi:Tfp pilus assembly protein PilV